MALPSSVWSRHTNPGLRSASALMGSSWDRKPSMIGSSRGARIRPMFACARWKRVTVYSPLPSLLCRSVAERPAAAAIRDNEDGARSLPAARLGIALCLSHRRLQAAARAREIASDGPWVPAVRSYEAAVASFPELGCLRPYTGLRANPRQRMGESRAHVPVPASAETEARVRLRDRGPAPASPGDEDERAGPQQDEARRHGDGGNAADAGRQTRQRQTGADGPDQRGGAGRQVDREQLRGTARRRHQRGKGDAGGAGDVEADQVGGVEAQSGSDGREATPLGDGTPLGPPCMTSTSRFESMPKSVVTAVPLKLFV